MKQYAEEHKHPGTKLTHVIGIPMIVASLPVAFVSRTLAGALFAGGWALQFIGHGVFEKRKPSFVDDAYYMLVGPVWVAAEYMDLLGIPVPEVMTPEADEKVVEHVNGLSQHA